jgi:hypothetical protein
MGGAYPYMDLNAKYEKLYYDVLLQLIQIRISRGLRISPIQRMGAAPGVIHTGQFFCPNSVVSGWKNERG